jgi:hypothetical protein
MQGRDMMLQDLQVAQAGENAGELLLPLQSHLQEWGQNKLEVQSSLWRHLRRWETAGR